MIGIIEEDPDEDDDGGRTTNNNAFGQKTIKLLANKARAGFDNQNKEPSLVELSVQ